MEASKLEGRWSIALLSLVGKSFEIVSKEQDDVWVVSINGQTHRMLMVELKPEQTVSKAVTDSVVCAL